VLALIEHPVAQRALPDDAGVARLLPTA
jgi:hypothetical protein